MQAQLRAWRSMRGRRIARGIVIALFALASLAALYLYRLMAVVRAQDAVVRARIAVISTPFEGRIANVTVKPGTRISKGEIVARMDTRLFEDEERRTLAGVREAEHRLAQIRADLVALRIQTAADRDTAEAECRAAESDLEQSRAEHRAQSGVSRAQIADAEAVLRKSTALLQVVRAGSRPDEIAAAKAGLRARQEAVVLAEKAQQRAARLYNEGAFSKSSLDEAEANLAIAQAQCDECEAQLRLLEAGHRPEEIVAEAMGVASAAAKVSAAGEEASLARAREAEVARRSAALDAARSRLRRLSMNDALVDAKAEEVAGAAAQLESMRAQLAEVQRKIALATLRADITGRVLGITATEGQWMEAQAEMLRIIEDTGYWIEATVAEKEAGRVQEGDKATVWLQGAGGHRKRAGGKVTGVSGMSTSQIPASGRGPGRGGVTIYVSCDQLRGALPGMHAEVVIHGTGRTTIRGRR